jgi:membrane protein implicated in regulation of membrane protease activity
MVLEMSLYLIIAIVCGITLIIMALFGFGDMGDFDFDAGPDIDIDGGHFDGGHGDAGAGLSPLSLPLILSFGTSFGAFGTIFTSMGWNPLVVPIIAALISLGISALMFFILLKVFIQTQANTQVVYSKMAGMTAEVTVPIKPGVNGQILVITEERGRTLITASSQEEIKTGTQVTIQKVVGSTAMVTKEMGLVD